MLETFQQENKITEGEKTEIVRHFTKKFQDLITEEVIGKRLWRLWHDTSPRSIKIMSVSTLDILKILYKMRNS